MQYFGFDRPSFAFKTFGFGANPDDAMLALFAGGKQGVWYDPSDKSTLFQDVAGTVPVTKDGDPVALMRDKSGNGNHATQTVSTARPVYKTDGILHWLNFDGADDFLSANFNPTAISTLRFFSSIKGVGTGLRVLYGTSYGKTAPVINKTLSGNITGIGYASDVGGYKSFNHSKPVSQPFVNTDVFDYTSNTFAYRDGLDAPIITSISNPKVFDSLLISSQTGSSFFMSGNLYGLIVGVNMIITNDALVMYLANKAGVTL